MNIRQMRPDDTSRLKELHKQSGFEYEFPELKEFFPIPVLVDENDTVVMAIASLPTVELYFFMDQSWETPGMKNEAFRLMHEFVRRDLHARGIIEANAFLPPQISKSFGKRLLKKFGWSKGIGWPCFSRRTDHV